MHRPAHILPVIVLAQLAGTSVWFAGNAVLPDLESRWAVDGAVAWITGAVQLGFIVGTLGSAVLRTASLRAGCFWVARC